jgi:peptide deformylase
MKLVNGDDPILKKECDKFDFANPPVDPIELAQDIVKLMYEHNGIVLTGNQAGLSHRVFALRGSPENFVCFNPRIVDVSAESVLLEESSITFPKLLVKVKRPMKIKVRFQTPNGETRTDTFTGITARAFQSAVDQLDGVLFYSRANKYHRDLGFKRWKK